MSRTAATVGMLVATLVIVVGVVAVFVIPRYQAQQREALLEQPQPILDKILAAQREHRRDHDTFWRGKAQTLTSEEAREQFGVDLAEAPDFVFQIFPPDLVRDPTLRIGARGRGPAEGMSIECVYDAVSDRSHCVTRS